MAALFAGSHQKPPPLVPVPPLRPSRPFAGVRLTLYRAKERGRQVLPPSFPSATLEIYYADSGGAAVDQGEAIPRRRGQCGGLRKFKTLFTLRAERLFATLGLLPPPRPRRCVHPPDVCTGSASRYSVLIYLFARADGVVDAINVGKNGRNYPRGLPPPVAARKIERRDLY